MNPWTLRLNSRPLFFKLLISIFLIYHLSVIVILPNSASYLGRMTGSWIAPYANFFGFNASWNFFSPDPAQTMFLKYTIWGEDDSVDPIQGFIPPEKEKIVLDSSKRRLLYAMRFLILDTNRMRSVLAPWLCRQHPGAEMIKMSHILEAIPSLDNAEVGRERELEGRKLLELSYECNGAKDEELL